MITPHAAQQMVLDSTMRYRIVATGRRWGKAELLHKVAAQHDLSSVLYVCVDYKHGKPFAAEYPSHQMHILSEGQALNEYRAKGLSPSIILIDEPAWMSPYLMDELWQMLINGGKLLAVGTPVPRKKGETDLLIELFRFAQQKRRFFDSATWHFSSRSNLFVDIDQGAIESMSEEMFRAEILGEFVTLPETKPVMPKYEMISQDG